ncbi:unnamed protein product [Acanthoscelides obtectus]|uniref:Uncharacterized protein n=1 Tax=Acanthoscelides obtectus TaxID=200917 RepID=A0A9P0KKJ4_ACAOB|nr:unnamed protein product [Acanthoscelides obtectus]CAK1669256.1 hypothetical protein AOBTE_LOCUS26901 [Acanthoscelides obtectus]
MIKFVPEDTTAQPPRKVRVTPIVLRDASRWRGVNHKFISLGIKFERAVAVDAGIRIIPKSEDDYRRIIRLFREEEVPHHTFPLPSERNIHAVIRGVHATLSEIEIKEELQQRGYSPLHIIRLKRGGGVPMPLVVVILPKIEKSQQLFNEHELLGLAIRLWQILTGKIVVHLTQRELQNEVDNVWQNEDEADSDEDLFGELSDRDEDYVDEQQSDTDNEQSDDGDEVVLQNPGISSRNTASIMGKNGHRWSTKYQDAEAAQRETILFYICPVLNNRRD